MRSIFVTIMMVAVSGLGVLFMAGCESDAQTGTAIGALAGAGIGALAGGDIESTLIGGAVGAGAGYMLGNEGDKKKAAADRDAIRAEQNIVTVWITNSNGSKTSVKLRKDGPGFIGPRGERYSAMPTEEELSIYGF